MTSERPVVIVTGGGGGIGAAIATEVARAGSFVVTMDPLLSVDGSVQLPDPAETTAGRIVAEGGAALASNTSVTDAGAVRTLVTDLVREHGRLDAVINVAGITRPTSFTSGSEEDWKQVLQVHLDGYLNILRAALPVMASAGRGRILGVTSGSGWRPANTGAYGCAKRAVASLTWQLGSNPPPGVTVNAISPIAVTRMVTSALQRPSTAPQKADAAPSATTGGLSLGSMPDPSDLGPIAAHLVSEDFRWCSGEVLFTGGPEVAVIDRPRLLEVLRTSTVHDLAGALTALLPGALLVAEEVQLSGGGSNPRFPGAYDGPDTPVPSTDGTCVVVTDRPDLSPHLRTALEARGLRVVTVDPAGLDGSFAAARDAMQAAVGHGGSLTSVVVALAKTDSSDGSASWEAVLAEHAGVTDAIFRDATWARAAVEATAGSGPPVRVVAITDATSSGGRSRAQAVAQHARSSRRSTKDRTPAFAVAQEESTQGAEVAQLVACLLTAEELIGLSGAELVVGGGWIGLRSHPRPGGSVVLGDPQVPDWFDSALRQIIRPSA